MPKTLTISTASKPYVEAEAIPDWDAKCISCSSSPTVVLITPCCRSVLYKTQLCGVCLWGEAACIDPKVWASES